MACSITIPFWPSSTDCVSWSKDNYIAVVGDEQIAVLSPRAKDPGPSGHHWDITLVTVNAFSAAELSPTEIFSDGGNYSIGEEIATRHAHAASWSSPGLTRHGGCALAVLTTDHVLSLWAPDGYSNKAENWKRKLVINHAVQQYYELDRILANGETDPDEWQRAERRKVQQRIIASTWSPPFHNDRERAEKHLFHGTQFLAVSSGAGDILFIRVDTPYSDHFGKHDEWTATVTGRFSVSQRYQTVAAMRATRSNAIPRPGASDKTPEVVARHIVWGEWMALESLDSGIATLAYIAEGKLSIARVQGTCASDPTASPSTDHQWLLRDRSDLCGPLRYVHEDSIGSLVAFGIDTVFYTRLAPGELSTSDLQSHHLDDRWDEVSGLDFTINADGSRRIHLVSQLSSGSAPTSSLRIPIKESGAGSFTPPSWQHAINNIKARFSAEHDLGGHVQDRTWGLASSPTGHYVATCSSMHISDAVSYVIGSDQASALNISFEGIRHDKAAFTSLELLATSGPLPMRTILFFLKRYLERMANADPPIDVDWVALLDGVLGMIPPGNLVQLPPPHVGGMDALLCHLRTALYNPSDLRRHRASSIINLAVQNSRLDSSSDRVVIEQVARSVLKLPMATIGVDEISMLIRRTQDIVLSHLDAQHQLGDIEPSAKGWHEVCKICHQSIAFESMKWARCERGHHFDRCALSFLSIQEPGRSKQCGICDLPYLDETTLPGFEPSIEDVQMTDEPDMEVGQSVPPNDTWVKISRNDGATAQSTTTLAQLLFAACYVCVYCGGQFCN